MKKNNSRDKLIYEMEKMYLSFLCEKGFEFFPLTKEESSPELSRAFPLGRLKRKSEKGLELVEVQFDKYGADKFVINFGVVPPEGVLLPWGEHLDKHTADTSALKDSYRLFSSRIFKRWFSYGLFSKKNNADAILVAAKAKDLSSEILNWFDFGKIGAHIKRL